MTLNSPTFLFIFLPAFLVIYFFLNSRLRSEILLLFSLIFIFWSDSLYAPFIIFLSLVNAAIIRRLQISPPESSQRTYLRNFGILLNILCLLFFKLLNAFSLPLSAMLAQSGVPVFARFSSFMPRLAHLPLGLSFLSFQAISLLVDISRQPLSQPLNFAHALLVQLMFPKIIAGPLVRLPAMLKSLKQRETHLPVIAAGLRRFMLGFAKKVLIADQLAQICSDGIFALPARLLPASTAWLVLLSYSLQIYFDFSAYSDMAIGLGLALGFQLPENFNQPYLSTSITEFWRRWHITLSNWFRDYIFFPLERRRAQSRLLSQPLNILIVFLLTGLWHGLTPPFIVWGLLHGAALVLEQSPLGDRLRRLWLPLQRIYTLFIILVGWVFFRSPNLTYAVFFFKSLLGLSSAAAVLPYSLSLPITHLGWIVLLCGIWLCLPHPKWLRSLLVESDHPAEPTGLIWVRSLLALALFALAVAAQASSSYLPFIYGEF